MAYIGNIPAEKYQTLQKQSFTTSATDTYTLSYSVTNPQDLALFINNVRQNPNDAYTVSGTTLTLSSAITSSDTMYAVFLGRAVETVAPATGSVTNAMLAGSIANSKLSTPPVFETQLLHIRDEKSQNVAGGGITGGSFTTRDLNTIKTNEITGASLSSNTITLPSGTYYIDASAPATEVASHRAKLRNTTDSTDVILGTTEHNRSDNNYAMSRSKICGRFTISAQKNFQLMHRCNATRNTDGLGVPSNIDTEVYSEVKIWKVA